MPVAYYCPYYIAYYSYFPLNFKLSPAELVVLDKELGVPMDSVQ